MGGVLLIYINPVQFPLHEPYFDLTPIKVMHTKIVILKYLLYRYYLNNNVKIEMNSNQTYCTYSFQRLTSG